MEEKSDALYLDKCGSTLHQLRNTSSMASTALARKSTFFLHVHPNEYPWGHKLTRGHTTCYYALTGTYST